MQHDHIMKKLDFEPTLVSCRGGGGLQAKYLLPCYCIRDSIKFDINHDHVLKKLTFDPGSAVCG